jgi:hypothetical protein
MSETYIGTTERAAIIRAELKAKHKWSSRDVSVKADHFSMGSAIRISIKNPAVPLAAVKEIASAHESISRDASGEILSGGNRYLDIGYSSRGARSHGGQAPAGSPAAAEVRLASAECRPPDPGRGHRLPARRRPAWPRARLLALAAELRPPRGRGLRPERSRHVDRHGRPPELMEPGAAQGRPERMRGPNPRIATECQAEHFRKGETEANAIRDSS